MATKPPVRASVQTPSYLPVEPLALPVAHCDVAGEGVEQIDVPVGVVGGRPVELRDVNDLEQPACLDLASLVRQLAWPWDRRVGRQSLTDLVVDLLDLDEERIPVVGDDVLCSPERELAPRSQCFGGLHAADTRVDPMPGRGGEDQIERLGS